MEQRRYFREEKKMEEELAILNRLLEEYKTCYVGDTNRTFNMAFVNYVEVGSLLTIAKAVTLGAMRRKESAVVTFAKTMQNVMMLTS